MVQVLENFYFFAGGGRAARVGVDWDALLALLRLSFPFGFEGREGGRERWCSRAVGL